MILLRQESIWKTVVHHANGNVSIVVQCVSEIVMILLRDRCWKAIRSIYRRLCWWVVSVCVEWVVKDIHLITNRWNTVRLHKDTQMKAHNIKGIVHMKMKMCVKFTHPQGIQVEDEFVSSSDLERCSITSLAHQWIFCS